MDEKPLQPDLKQLLANFHKNADEFEKIIREQSRLMRIAFQALTAEGFSDYQALEIIKARGCMLG